MADMIDANIHDPRIALDALERLARSLGCLVPHEHLRDRVRRDLLVRRIVVARAMGAKKEEKRET